MPTSPSHFTLDLRKTYEGCSGLIMSIYQPIQAPLKGRGMRQSRRELLWYCEYMPPSRISAQRGMRDNLTKPISNPRYPSNSSRFHDRSCIPRLEYKTLVSGHGGYHGFSIFMPQVFKLPTAGACVNCQKFSLVRFRQKQYNHQPQCFWTDLADEDVPSTTINFQTKSPPIHICQVDPCGTIANTFAEPRGLDKTFTKPH